MTQNISPKYNRPLISVILIFFDPRGQAKHIKSWTKGQTLPGNQFEIIVVATSSKSLMADDIRSYLRPQDQLICGDSDEPFELIPGAAEAAKADILFFSEDHCLAKRDCLETALNHMEETGAAGVSVLSGFINLNTIAKMEQRVYERDLSTWFLGDHWNKLRFRGFAISRKAYQHIGGFQGQYSNFSEAALAAQLHASGYTVDYLDKGGVMHINTTSFSELFGAAWKYSWHECKYCEENDPEFCAYYFTTAYQFLQQHAIDSDTRAWLRQATRITLSRELLKPLNNPRRDVIRLTGTWIKSALSGIFGIFGMRVTAYSKLAVARLRFIFWAFHNENQYRAFEEYWLLGADCARADYLSQRTQPPSNTLPVWRKRGLEVPAHRATGYYGAEPQAGKTLIWTKPASIFTFTLSPADYRMTIDIAGFRNCSRRTPIGLFWNRHALPEADLVNNQLSIIIPEKTFSEDDEQQLTIITSLLWSLHSRDARSLGLPIYSIHFEPV